MATQFFLGGGLAAILAVLFFKFFGSERRSSVPLIVWGACLVLGFSTVMYSLIHSTGPSFAPRITAVGKVSDCFEPHSGKHFDKYVFHFEPESGAPFFLETRILTPPVCLFRLRGTDTGTYRIVYLDDSHRNPSNEPIDNQVVSGAEAGWHQTLDAGPFGIWLGVPFGFALSFIGLGCIRLRKYDSRPAQEPTSSN
jgi:hypothetical protein